MTTQHPNEERMFIAVKESVGALDWPLSIDAIYKLAHAIVTHPILNHADGEKHTPAELEAWMRHEVGVIPTGEGELSDREGQRIAEALVNVYDALSTIMTPANQFEEEK